MDKTMNELTPFTFETRNVRVIDQGGEPWFVAKDVVEAVEATAMASQDCSVMAWGNLYEIPVTLSEAKILGERCAQLSKELGFPMGKAADPRFGRVNTYMEAVLKQVFGEYLDGDL
jgi:prophage antirepressor-like protein